jgi:radical SAM protein with 4Fe4S-binding SPASM domain
VLAMRDYAEKDLGTGFKYDAQIHPRIDNDQGPVDVRLSPMEAVAFDLVDRRRMDEWTEFARTFHAPPTKPEELYSCGAGIGSFAIDPFGFLSMCVLSKRDQFDLRRSSFHDGWQTFLNQVRHRPARRTTKCTHCHLRAMCGMCPANGELANDDPEEPVDFLCETAHLRAHVIGLSIPAHGECEYCPDGQHHDALLAKVAQLQGGGHETLLTAPPGQGGRHRFPKLRLLPVDEGGCGSSCQHPQTSTYHE